MKTQLLIADYIGRLHDNKMAVMGLYADRVIMLHIASDGDTPLQIGMPSLSFAVTVFDLEPGSYPLSASILLPDGGVAWHTSGPTVAPDQPGPATFVFAIAPLMLPQQGDYIFELKLGQLTAQHTFTVRHLRQPG